VSVRFSLSREPILAPVLSAADAGGFVDFVGRVRNSNEGKAVVGLEYEAYDELALSEGRALLEEAVRRFGLMDAACVHRLGPLKIGDAAVAISVAAPHRRQAFAACEYVIDQLKQRVPIWKKEHYAEGPSDWVGISPTPSDLYRRQITLPEVGCAGQERLGSSKVLVVGAGGLGCPALLYLAAAGVGQVGICDGDKVDCSNLHREILFGLPEVGQAKAITASATLSRMYPHVKVVAHPVRLTHENADEILGGYNLVLDCTEGLRPKFLLNDRCVGLGIPFVQASIHQFEGQIQVVIPALTSCLRCLFPSPPTDGCVGNCAESGVLGFTAGLFGTMQAAEAVKLLLGIGRPLTEETLLVDLRDWSTIKVRRERDPGCPACGSGNMERPLEVEWREALALNANWIDVREPVEVAAEPGPTSVDWIRKPLSTFDGGLPAGTLVIACAHGVRSAGVAAMLRQQGREAYSLAGGIDGLVDRTVP